MIGERAGPGRRATPDMLLGYTIANDVSARDLQRDDGQWVRAKSLDTFLRSARWSPPRTSSAIRTG